MGDRATSHGLEKDISRHLVLSDKVCTGKVVAKCSPELPLERNSLAEKNNIPLMTTRITLLAVLAATSMGLAQDAGTVIELKPSANVATPLAYDKTDFTAKAGERIKLVFSNNGGALPQPHNVVLCKPGTGDKVVAAAMSMLTDPNGMAKAYVPESADIIAHTLFAQPGETKSTEVTLPAEVGDYPFFCTFPGHAAIMKGVIKVGN